jgi:hypothetical protein
MTGDRPLVIVSKSEPEDAPPRLTTLGLNAVSGEGGSDYVWYPHTKTFAIERKTITNFLQSLKDRQLVEQAQKGTRLFDRYFLLIEGDFREEADGHLAFHAPKHPEAGVDGWVYSGWLYASVEGMLVELALLGVTTLRCRMFQYDRRVAGVVLNTSRIDHQGFIRERMRPMLPPDMAFASKLYTDAVWALCALDGCGPKVATALLNEYKSLDEVIMHLSGRVKVKGIRPASVRLSTGKRIGKALEERLRRAVTTC